MNYKVDFHPLVLPELNDATNWYEERTEGLGARFNSVIHNVINSISENPYLHSKKTKRFREALTSEFPYAVIYEISEKRENGFCYVYLPDKKGTQD
jgi:hypothetical protein